MTQNLEIKQISEREIWLGENKSKLIKGNIIHVIARGEQTLETATMQLKINEKLMSLVKGKVSYLIDLNNAGKNSIEARQIWMHISESETTHKIAMFGLHPVARVIASFAMGMSKSTNQRFFKTEDEAMNWILE